MPELPEVETVARTLAPRLVGRTILHVEFRSPRVSRHCPQDAAGRMAGSRIDRIERHGKYLAIHCDRGVLTVHLRMTGKLLADAEPGPYARAVFQLDDGQLVFDDVRQFGTLEWSDALPDRLAKLGPDAASLPFDEFWGRLRSRRGRIKPLLLDQAFIRGMGNIYVDEALHRAGLHPRTPTHRIGKARAERLHREMVNLLALAIAHRGSSVSDYVDAEGRPGGFQSLHQVYGRAGDPCSRCGTPIRRIVVAQRGTHYCPRCQRG